MVTLYYMDHFKKDDEGKVKLSLLPIKAKKEIAKVLEFGANKYGRDNWRNCTDNYRYLDATLRHLDAFIDGEDLDSESNLNHLAHAAANLMILIELLEDY
jgi:hypothetical protein